MKYTDNDLMNIIAICELEAHSNISVPAKLAKRCRDVLVYRDKSMRLTKNEKAFLQYMYDKQMDEDAQETLERILK